MFCFGTMVQWQLVGANWVQWQLVDPTEFHSMHKSSLCSAEESKSHSFGMT